MSYLDRNRRYGDPPRSIDELNAAQVALMQFVKTADPETRSSLEAAVHATSELQPAALAALPPAAQALIRDLASVPGLASAAIINDSTTY